MKEAISDKSGLRGVVVSHQGGLYEGSSFRNSGLNGEVGSMEEAALKKKVLEEG